MQMIMAGATAVGVGSALLRRGRGVFGAHPGRDWRALMAEEGIATLDEIRGCAHG